MAAFELFGQSLAEVTAAPAPVAPALAPKLEKVRALALGLLAEHGLDNWTVAFDSARQRAGICRREQREIGLSKLLMVLWTEGQQRETILHEIAHALAPAGAGHDWRWQRVCVKIGAIPVRCWDEADNTREQVPFKYIGTCPRGHTIGRDKLTTATRRRSCDKCDTRFNPRYLFTWTLTSG
jgi:predicted SprT family Zn-dependent metalloprotease